MIPFSLLGFRFNATASRRPQLLATAVCSLFQNSRTTEEQQNCPRALMGPAHVVRRARVSGIVTAALLSEIAEVVPFPDLRSEVPEDRVSHRDVEEEVR